ncbi:MAG: FIST C-terminal domain-containing protein [Chitinophagaceae bacterium]|nr:FIST C-terminal domain-containing protein [Chitinophagaceae bacterium]MBK8607781.1 FIST C-terminal domain-containing protein [Chitinophagaceae bacterium]MBP6477407.1 FIST C-terminal domain-containing protein [Chitinophagaceae bacterium]MBP7107063.1 FIST C-terminal domain-containing protein [Chitinophagaceae bacterium]MBP7315228.1 FIST C-terminal domain-containing protein [Chitinophagaceae bacterium]
MKAKSIKGKSTEEISLELEKSLVDGYKPTLAILFISIKQDRKAIIDLLLQNNIDVFGCTSCGEFINGYQSEGEAVILLLDANREHYTILIEDVENGNVDKTASLIATSATKHFKNPTFLLTSNGVYGDGQYFDGNTLVNSLVRELGEDSVFFGGMAGDDWNIQNSFIFTHQRESDNGIAAMVFDADKISLQGMAIHGWKPLGITRKVTKSSGNKVYSIDGKPAVEMYLKYLGMSEKTEDESFDIFKDLSIHFPFIARREEGETMIKSPRSIDAASNALIMDIEMEEGSEFHFSTPPDFEISEEIISEAAAVKSNMETQPDALLIFSCAGRPPVLGPLTTIENDGLAEVWQVPMAGFYTYGEFGRMKNGKQHFHSSVCCWVALKEK